MIPREGQQSLGGQQQLIAMGEAGLHWGGGKSRQQANTLGIFILYIPVPQKIDRAFHSHDIDSMDLVIVKGGIAQDSSHLDNNQYAFF